MDAERRHALARASAHAQWTAGWARARSPVHARAAWTGRVADLLSRQLIELPRRSCSASLDAQPAGACARAARPALASEVGRGCVVCEARADGRPPPRHGGCLLAVRHEPAHADAAL